MDGPLTAKEAFMMSSKMAEELEWREWNSKYELDELSINSILNSVKASATKGYFTCHIESQAEMSHEVIRALLELGYGLNIKPYIRRSGSEITEISSKIQILW